MADGRLEHNLMRDSNSSVLTVSPATHHLLNFIQALISSLKGKTSAITSKIVLPRHLHRGWQMTVAAIVRAFSKVANHMLEKEGLHGVFPLFEQCSLAVGSECASDCATMNDWENLDNDIESCVYHQWQLAEIPPPRHRSYSHLQHLWKKSTTRASSRCNSRLNQFSPSQGSSSVVDDEDLDDLECERLSQVSGSAITAVNVGANAQNLVDVQQQLAALQKQLAMVFELQQQQLQQQQKAALQLMQPGSSSSVATSAERKAAPPPPPLPPNFLKKSSTTDASAKPLLLTKAVSSSAIGNKAMAEKPYLMDVLKDISNVRLKKVEGFRSPNGTPMRHSSDRNGQFLAQALKQQFRNVRPIESDDDTDSTSNGAWDEEAET